MAISFPSSLDSFSNPTSTDLLENVVAALDHDVQHSNANDAIEALEAKVGVNSSAVTTSHDYKLSAVTGSEKALTSGTSTQTVSGLTLTSPVVNVTSDATGDMYYRSAGGVFTRLPIGSNTNILSVSSAGIPEWIANPDTSNASTTVKGIVEIGTQAEVDAGTDTGGTGATNAVIPSTLRAKLLNTGVLDTGSANAVAIAPSPAITAYAAYQEFTFKAGATNTGATTINVNSLGTKNIFNQGAALRGGEIVSGQMYKVAYDGTQFNLISQPSQDTDGLVYEGTESWSASTSDKTITFINSGRRMYIMHFAFDIAGQINLRFNGDSSALYNYTTLSTTTLSSSATQTSMALVGASSLSAVGTLNVVGLSTGAGSRAIGVSGHIATRNDVANLQRGYWSPSGTTSLSSVTFLVNSTSTTGSVRVYSIAL